MAQKRDYKAEYQRRIASGLKRGLSRSQARGHPAITELPAKQKLIPSPDRQLEAGLRQLRKGQSQKAAAEFAGISQERFRRFIYGHGLAERQHGEWVMTDGRPRRVSTIHRGEQKALTVGRYSEAEKAGRYSDAVGVFVRTNDLSVLEPFDGDGLTDHKGRFYLFETDPNALHRLAAQDTPAFHEIYQIVS